MERMILRSLGTLRSAWRTFGRNDAGSMLSLLATVPVLAGTVAIGVETGKLYSVKRQMQNAADDAALAGAIDSMAGSSTSTITTDAQYETKRNGFTNGTNNVTVAVNVPPSSGPNVTTPNAVEVIVSVPQKFSLGSVLNSWLGRSTAGFTMQARSVAAQTSITSTTTSTSTTTNSVGCLVALTPNAEQGVNFTNFSSFSSNCAIMSNGTSTSNNSSASVYLASFSSLTANTVWTRGSYYATGYSSLTLTTAAQTNQSSSIVDPNSSLGTPSPGSCGYTNYNPPSNSSITLSPNTYCGGLKISNFSTVKFTPGTYYIANGNFQISGVSTVSCPTCTSSAGLAFVLTQTTGNNANIGGVSFSNLSSVTLNAGTNTAYPGILFYQDRRATAGTMNSTSNIFSLSNLSTATLYGAIYFPQNVISVSNLSSAGNSTTGCTVWIGRYIKFTSYSSAYITGCSTYGTTPAGYSTTTTTTSSSTVNKGKVLE